MKSQTRSVYNQSILKFAVFALFGALLFLNSALSYADSRTALKIESPKKQEEEKERRLAEENQEARKPFKMQGRLNDR